MIRNGFIKTNHCGWVNLSYVLRFHIEHSKDGYTVMCDVRHLKDEKMWDEVSQAFKKESEAEFFMEGLIDSVDFGR